MRDRRGTCGDADALSRNRPWRLIRRHVSPFDRTVARYLAATFSARSTCLADLTPGADGMNLDDLALLTRRVINDYFRNHDQNDRCVLPRCSITLFRLPPMGFLSLPGDMSDPDDFNLKSVSIPSDCIFNKVAVMRGGAVL